MPRLAWFSPLPPVRSGIARYCSDLLPGLAAGEYDIDLFVDGPPVMFESPHERVQLFNALNHVQFNDPEMNLQNPQTFGVVNSQMNSPRTVVIGVRASF